MTRILAITLILIAGTLALHPLGADGQTPGRQGGDKEQDFRKARDVIEKYRTGTIPYKDLESAVKTISVYTNKQMACEILVGAIDLEEPSFENDEIATQFEKRFPAVNALIQMGDVCAHSLFAEVKNPRTRSSRSLAEYVLLQVLGFDAAIALAEKEPWRSDQQRANLNETVIKWKAGRGERMGTNSTSSK